MTVLGEFVLPNGGQAWTRTVIALMGHLGIREKAVRQALARTEERGLLSRERHGRQTKWVLTNAATSLLEAGAERIYTHGQTDASWDRHWVMLLASVPETDRTARYRMGVGLSWAGFGSLGQGVWVSPWRDQEAAAVSLLQELDIDATSFIANVGQLGSGASIATQGWDLPALHESYTSFLHETAGMPDKPEGVAAAASLTTLVHLWRRFPFLDPGLPSDVLPADWLGARAVERFQALRSTLSPAAQTWWSQQA